MCKNQFMRASRFSIFFALFLVYFLDIGGIGVVFVTFSPLIVSDASPFLSPATDLGTRNLILGLLFAAYPLTQFFGAPLLGGFSDRIGRKPILIISTLVTAISFCLSAISILFPNLALLFLSRIIGGFAAGNSTVAQAAISDMVEEKKRPRYMSGFAMIGGLSWIIFPFLGSVLSDKALVSWFSNALPFAMMGAGFFLSFLLVLFWKETFAKKSETRLSLFEGIYETVFSQRIFMPLLLSLTMIFAWLIYQGFISPYLIEKFHKTEIQVGGLFAYFSTCWFLGGLLSNQWLLKKYSPEKANLLPLFIVGVAIASLVLIQRVEYLWIATALSNICAAINVSCFFGIISHAVPSHQQGKVFGIWNAGFALASAMAPVLAGWLSRYYLDLPFIIAALLLFSTAFVYLRWFRQVRKS